jgi:hypothetical protein
VANNNHVDPIEGVSAASKQQELITLQKSAQSEENAWKKALETKNPVHKFSCFWLVIQMINHVGLDVSDGAVIAQAQLMDVEHKMQQCMIKISKAISNIQGHEQGYHFYQDGAGKYAPDMFLGLVNPSSASSGYYNMSMGAGANSPSQISEFVAPDFKKDTNDLITAIKQLYYSDASDASAPSVGDLSKIVNPFVWQNGKDFDLKGLWSSLEGKFNAAGLNNPYQTSFKMISSDPSSKASLLQQYMYYKAQSTIYTTNSDTVNGAQGDITKLVCFDPPSSDPTQSSHTDEMITQILQALNIFTGSCSLNTSLTGVTTNQYLLQPVTEPLLKLILLGINKIYTVADGTTYAGVYAELNMEAYNSYWAKPSADKSAQDIDSGNLGTPTSGSWTKVDGTGSSSSEVLGYWYGQTNSVQTSIGSDTSSNSSTMQAMTANEGSEVTVGQNSIKALNQYVNAVCQNQNSA